MVWELTFGVYLIANGFTPAARRQNAVTQEGGSISNAPCASRRTPTAAFHGG
jgi:hypothetical protein